MKRIIPIIVIILFLIPYSLTAVHGLYVGVLPNNTLYADDFESYQASGSLESGTGSGTGSANGYGWSYYDSDPAGGIRNVTTHAYYSPSHALMLQSSDGPNDKFDVHRSIAISNTTRLISMSIWFAFDNKTRNQNNQLTFSLEFWDYAKKYECVANVYPNSANVGAASDDATNLVGLRIAAIDDTRMLYARGFWHHIIMVCDILNKKYVSLFIDNWDITGPAGLSGAKMGSTADAEMLISTKPFTIPLRLEFANVNAGTFVSATDVYHKWVDDIIITDVSPGAPSIIQFAINGAAIILLVFIGIIGILYYLRIGDRLMFGKGKGLFGSRSVIKYKEQRATTAEQEAKRMIKVIAIILIIGAILTAFGLYFAGFI